MQTVLIDLCAAFLQFSTFMLYGLLSNDISFCNKI